MSCLYLFLLPVPLTAAQFDHGLSVDTLINLDYRPHFEMQLPKSTVNIV